MLRDALTTPSATALQAFLRLHTRPPTDLVQVIGQAEVVYVGRAASTADVGSYLVLLKGDGSLQIHHGKGVKPMNWQPRTDEVSVGIEDGCCVLLASRRSPEEHVRVRFLEVAIAQAFDLPETGGFVLQGSEAQMQRVLAARPELIEPGLTVLKRELLVDSGGIDLYARDAQGRYVVVELKRGRATQDAVSQLTRYVRSVQRSLPEGHAPVRGILAAPSMTAPALAQLRGLGLEFKEITALSEEEVSTLQPSLFSF